MSTYSINEDDQLIEITFNGDVTLENSMAFKEEIKGRLQTASKNVLVNLSNVPFMDSSGLGLLISLFKQVNENKKKIVYYGVQDYVHKLLNIVKLNKIFIVAENKEEALSILENE